MTATLRLWKDFYPRPPRGGRRAGSVQRNGATVFLSTPSARRATPEPWPRRWRRKISIHALREEGDARVVLAPAEEAISIHALREEGDSPTARAAFSSARFLSTPSARRATSQTSMLTQ